MIRFIQALYGGLGAGSIYALIAVGFVIIYKSTRIISFAQPGLMVVGALTVAYLGPVYGLPFFLAVPLAMLLIAGLGMVIERAALRPMVGKPVFVMVIITLGIDVVLRVVANRFIGVTVRPVGDPWGFSTFTIAGVPFQTRFLIMLAALAAVVGVLFAFFRYSRMGLAMRAAAFDQETALAQGISVGAVFALSWAIAAALATLAGVFVGTGTPIDQGTWVIALKALPAIIIGGLDSVGGAVIGGLAVGVVESLVAAYQPAYAPWLGNNFELVSPYVVLLLVLLVRPYGLFGTPEVERV
ncbi:MAG: branched-chain amino acid ABC transporter permease [Nitriliruptorales bacterium]|nr:branched-chain amino acid ABC transporter permease [Nitriliruptorales bacterium]